MRNRKAQIAMLDLVLAFVAAFGLIIILLSFIDQPTNIINDRIQVEDKLIKALEATDILLNNHGTPVSWTALDVQIPSIVNSQNFINNKKLAKFMELPYETKKDLLNLNAFNYTLVIKLNNTEIRDGITNKEAESVTINRIALYGEKEIAYIQFKVW